MELFGVRLYANCVKSPTMLEAPSFIPDDGSIMKSFSDVSPFPFPWSHDDVPRTISRAVHDAPVAACHVSTAR